MSKIVQPVTTLGWTVLALGLVVWVVSARFDWKEGFIIASICLVLFGFGIIATVGRLSLDAQITVSPARVVVGERTAGELLLTNKRSRAAYALRIELPIGKAVAPFEIARLKGGGSTDELFVVPTQKRAVIQCGPVTSVKGDPLGMMRRVERWTDVHEIYVHPRTTRLSTIAAGQIRDLEGQTTSALSPSDIAFHTLREYSRGDDLRHVHWKTSAKMGTLMVRQYNDTRRSHIALVLSIDPNDYADDDEYELGISCAASVGVQAIQDDQTLTVIVGDTLFPATGTTRLLDHFSGIEAVPGHGSLDSAVKAVRRYAPNASVAVICTGSKTSFTDVRRSVARAGLDMGSLVLRANPQSVMNYQTIGESTFVNVPTLESLRRGLVAVTS